MQKTIENISFKGKGAKLFEIYIVNITLTVLTLGIYSFWAKIRTRKFFHQNTWYLESNFDFHATGKERSAGFLKAALLFGVAYFIILGIEQIVTPLVGQLHTDIIKAFAVIFLLVGLSPLISVGKRRFLLSRTSWRNVRFRFTGKILELSKINIIGTFLTIITLGIYSPWYACKRRKFKINNSYFGSEPFSYHGDGAQLLKINLKGLLLTIVTFGIYSYWWKSEKFNYHWGKTQFQGTFINSNMKGAENFAISTVCLLMIVGTLGIASPWAAVLRAELQLQSLSYPGEPDFLKIQGNVDREASALADGLDQAGDILESISDIF